MTILAITAAILGLLAGAGWGLAAALWCAYFRRGPFAEPPEPDLEIDPDQPVRSCLPDEWHAERGAPSFRPPGGHAPPAAGPRPTRPPRRPPTPL